jgi:PAS domain S-box-containing protein
MTSQWNWIALGVLIALVLLYQEFRIYRIRQTSKKREELFQIVTENAADMIALVDMKARRLYNSPAYKRVLGYSAAELGETSSFEQIHPDDRFKVLEAAREARSSGIGRKLDYRIRHKDGTWRILESIASAIRNEKGEVNKLVIVNRDVTERKRAEEQLEHNSFHDALTGLPNRRLFLDRLQHLFARAQRNPECQCAVLFVDLDGFKTINDTLQSYHRRSGDYRDGQSSGNLFAWPGYRFAGARYSASHHGHPLQNGRRRIHHPSGGGQRSQRRDARGQTNSGRCV